MWIESEQGKSFTDVQNAIGLFIINRKPNKYYVSYDVIGTDRVKTLGVYRTKERASEVLNEIKKELESHALNYKMPKE